MPDIFDEVEEDLRAERMKRMLARYGGLLTGAALLVVATVAGPQGWRWYEARGAGDAAATYLAAGRAATEPNADLKSIAARYEAMATERGRLPDPGPAARRGAEIRGRRPRRRPGRLGCDRPRQRHRSVYRDLATLLWGLHSVDAGDPAAVEARLAPLAQGPWRASAEEVRALAAMKRNDTDAAKRILTALSTDPMAPQGVRDRAGRLLAGLGG